MQSNFYDAIERYRFKPFVWGEHDCCLFAANVLQEVYGVDYMAEIRGTYHDEESAKEALKVHGGNLFNTLKKLFGEPKSTTYARVGDVVLAQAENGPTVGICLGLYSAFVGQEKMQFRYTHEFCKYAWEVK